MITFIIVLVVAFWLLRPKLDIKQIEPCEKHEWVEDRNGKIYTGLYCKKCLKRPGG